MPINQCRVFELLQIRAYSTYNDEGRITGWFSDPLGFLSNHIYVLDKKPGNSQYPLS
jgi:hypothetical protein